MADFLEGTTIGGSIAITEKNIYDYLDDIIADTSIDRLAPKTNSFEEYIKAFNIIDLNTLSPSRDIGLYITTGVTTPDANIYGTYEIPGNLKTSTWTNTQSKLDVAKYNLTKSPMADKSLLFIFNNDFDPTINKLTLMCYHIDSGVWYRMNQIKGTDKLSKKWEVDLQVQLHYDNMRKLSNVIDDLFSDKMDKSKNLSDVVNVTEARRNLNIALTDVVGSGLSTLYSSQKLSKDIDDKVNANVIVTNETKANLTKTDGKLADTITDLNNYKVSNDKNILDAKTDLNNYKVSNDENILDTKTTLETIIDTKLTETELISKSIGSNKWLREGAYGLGGGMMYTGDSNTEDLEDLLGRRTSFFVNNHDESFIRNSYGIYFVNGRNTEYRGVLSFGWTPSKIGEVEFTSLLPNERVYTTKFITDKNTSIDPSGFLRASGTATALTTSNLVQSTGTSTYNIMTQKAVTDMNASTKSRADDAYNLANARLEKSKNLSDLANAGTARTNLGLGNSATLNKTDALGTSTGLLATQRLVNDVSVRTTTAQNRADSAYSLAGTRLEKSKNLSDLANAGTARTNLGLGNSAIRNMTSSLGTSTTLVASQKLVNDVKVEFDDKFNNLDTTIHVTGDPIEIYKSGAYAPIFSKVSASSIKVNPNTYVRVEGIVINISGKVIELTDKLAGNDYVVTVDRNGNLNTFLDKFEDPASISSGNYIIGGFFYSEVPENETLSTGLFATSGNGMIWTQNDVDKIRGINEFSLWDLRFRAGGYIASPSSVRYGELSNHGMVYDFATNRWYAIYHAGTDVDKYGISRAGTDIASGTVLAKVPSAYSGNGTKKYNNLDWWTTNELANSQGSRLMYEFEFNNRAFGTTENKVAGGTSVTYPKTERIKGLTSRIGCEQVTGVQWYWGLDSSSRHDGSEWSYKDVTGGRGQYFTFGTHGHVKALFGGFRKNDPSYVGSRQVNWNGYPWNTGWSVGLVATRDLLIL